MRSRYDLTTSLFTTFNEREVHASGNGDRSIRISAELRNQGGIAMSKQLSYSKVEQNILPGFRQNINHAESTEDVRKYFGFAVRDLIIGVFRQEIEPFPDDVVLAPDSDSGFSLGKRLQANELFMTAWQQSDLPNIVGRLAETAVKHHRHLAKNPGKTELKIYHNS